jgi:peptidoglycan hydrolase-like protein with peptidoglycan-binding domain
MRRTILLCFLGAVLLASAAPVIFSAAKTTSKQSSARKKRTATTSKKKKAKSTSHGQTAPTPDRVREIQSALQREGALQEDPTGSWDNATVAAMRKYQDDHGLNPTGKIDALTLQKLGLGSETAGKGAPIMSAPSAVPPANPTQ